MNFLEIQNEVITNRFDASQRPQVKNWINFKYGRLWALENWTFKYQLTTLSVSSGATSIARGTVGDIIRIWDKTISPGYSGVLAVRPEDLWDVGSQTTTGAPYEFSVIGNTIYFERPMEQNRTFQVISTIPFTALINDGDNPLLPSEFHYLLVSGATAVGLTRENDPAATQFEQDWQNGIDDLKSAYLTSLRTANDSYPDWP
jgi:hypothetical protein